MSLKAPSPSCAKTSSMERPDAATISSSTSTNRQPRVRAASRPAVVFPEPEKPVMKMLRFTSWLTPPSSARP